MNSGPILFLGLFFSMACSWLTFVLGPQLQIGRMLPATNMVSAVDETYPNPSPGTAAQGAQVYRAEGCAACHTQQVRAKTFGADIARGWGIRPSVGFDYLFDQPPMLGDLRVGPDLANVGLRMDRAALLMKLYDPKLRAPASVMPSFRFLFRTQKIEFAPSPDALALSGALAPPAGYEVVPTPLAEQLVSYLLSRRQNVYIFVAPPPPPPPTNAVRVLTPAAAPSK